MYKPVPLWRRITLLIVSLVIYTSAAVVVLFMAHGYQFNFREQEVRRSGILSITTIPDNATVIVDHVTLKQRTPIELRELMPGLHTVRIEKDGYLSWEQTVILQSEYVTFLSDIYLVPEHRKPLEFKSDILAFDLTSDRSKLAYLSVDGDQQTLGILNAPFETSNAETYTIEGQIREFDWSADSTTLLITRVASDETIYELLHTDEKKISAIPLPSEVRRAGPLLTWGPTNQTLYFLDDGTLWEMNLQSLTLKFLAQDVDNFAVVDQKVWLRQGETFLSTPPTSRSIQLEVTIPNLGDVSTFTVRDSLLLVVHDQTLSAYALSNRNATLLLTLPGVRKLPLSMDGEEVIVTDHEVWQWDGDVTPPTLVTRYLESISQVKPAEGTHILMLLAPSATLKLCDRETLGYCQALASDVTQFELGRLGLIYQSHGTLFSLPLEFLESQTILDLPLL